jgi:hypothetical protein
LFHIGAETVRASAATSTTVTVSNRGAGGTPIQIHSTTNNGTNVPEITTEIITFRGRRASIWIAQQSPDGTVSDYSEIVNGFIESTPTIEDGNTINISIVPLTALFDNSLSQVSVQLNYSITTISMRAIEGISLNLDFGKIQSETIIPFINNFFRALAQLRQVMT